MMRIPFVTALSKKKSSDNQLKDKAHWGIGYLGESGALGAGLQKSGQDVLLEGVTTKFFYEESFMSATILYHMYGVRGYGFIKQRIVPGGIEFELEVARDKLCCPDCKSTNVWLK